MQTILCFIFIAAYLAIALEHPIKVNKSASALIGAGLLWTVYAISSPDLKVVNAELGESLMGTAQIVFFLMGAMAIVEVIDAHRSFEIITKRIKTTRLSRLLWIVGFASFFLSSILDNLTTTIVMVSLMKQLLEKREDRLFFAGIIVIAANAGGAWTPIGDVTTTMLWIGGQITTAAIMQGVFLASIVNLLVPLAIAGSIIRAQPVVAPHEPPVDKKQYTSSFEKTLMLALGLGILISIPVFKSTTHLPPFLGILLGLGIIWMVGDLMHQGKDENQKQRLTLASALTRIDMTAMVFFIGILLAVAVMEHSHILKSLAQWLDTAVGRQDLIVFLIGLVSAVIDNVPLVAAAMGMYDLQQYPVDSFLWQFLAYCAGTGGSILIIGSAAGVAAMGLEKIDFIWYLKKIGPLALAGYTAGAVVFIAQHQLVN